jgi:hypothetical protein
VAGGHGIQNQKFKMKNGQSAKAAAAGILSFAF